MLDPPKEDRTHRLESLDDRRKLLSRQHGHLLGCVVLVVVLAVVAIVLIALEV